MSFLTKAMHALGFARSPRVIATNAQAGVLEPGQMYRVWAEVAEPYVKAIYDSAGETLGQAAVQEQLAADLVTVGFAHALICVQDPSDPHVWTFIARWAPNLSKRSSGPPSVVGPVHFLRYDPVEEPTRVSPRVNVPSLDVGLSEDDLYFIRRTLTLENDPKRLAGMATAYDEDFPIVASLLRNKARLEAMNAEVNVKTGPIRVSERAGLMHPLTTTHHPTLSALREASRDIGDGDYLDLYANVFDVLTWTPPTVAAHHGQQALYDLEPELATLTPEERSTGFGKIATLFSRKPEMARESSLDAVARDTGIPRVLVAAGVAAVSDHGHGLVTFDPQVVRALRPNGPRPVAAGALKMAFATLRPEGSLSASPGELGPVLTDLAKAVRAGDPFALRADQSLKRARRYLDRQDWTAWTRRYETAEGIRL